MLLFSATPVTLFPNNIFYKILFPENLITKLASVVYLTIIDANKDHPILPQQIPRQIQPWIHHVQPLGMEPPVGVGVGAELASLGVHLPGVFPVSYTHLRAHETVLDLVCRL